MARKAKVIIPSDGFPITRFRFLKKGKDEPFSAVVIHLRMVAEGNGRRDRHKICIGRRVVKTDCVEVEGVNIRSGVAAKLHLESPDGRSWITYP